MSDAEQPRAPKRFPLTLDKVSSSRTSMASSPLTTSAASMASSASQKPATASAPRDMLRPQAPLHQAALDRQRQHVPVGVGLDGSGMRQRMVNRLQQEGITHPGLLEAFTRIPRHWFVDTALVNQAYEDTSLPIGLGQTISKPSVIASMIMLLLSRPGMTESTPKPLGRCLDIGTGCGYQAAILSCQAKQVVSVERLQGLHTKARAHLNRLRSELPGWPDVRLVYGDGMLGHPPQAPYDTIISAAGGDALPPAWLDQLAPGGRLVAPIQGDRAGQQQLVAIDKLADGSLQRSVAGQVLFVPLKSGVL